MPSTLPDPTAFPQHFLVSFFHFLLQEAESELQTLLDDFSGADNSDAWEIAGASSRAEFEALNADTANREQAKKRAEIEVWKKLLQLVADERFDELETYFMSELKARRAFVHSAKQYARQYRTGRTDSMLVIARRQLALPDFILSLVRSFKEQRSASAAAREVRSE